MPTKRPAIWNKLDKMIERGDRYLYLATKDFEKYCGTLPKEQQRRYAESGMLKALVNGYSHRCVTYKGSPVIMEGTKGIKIDIICPMGLG